MDPEAASGAGGSSAVGLPVGMVVAAAAVVSDNCPPLDAQECATARAFFDRWMPAIRGASKAELLAWCHQAGLPGNKNNSKW